jgi:hypothetical protein
LDKAAEFSGEAAAANFAMDLVGNTPLARGRAHVAGRFCDDQVDCVSQFFSEARTAISGFLNT